MNDVVNGKKYLRSQLKVTDYTTITLILFYNFLKL